MLPAQKKKKKWLLIQNKFLKTKLFFQVALLSSVNMNQEILYQEY